MIHDPSALIDEDPYATDRLDRELDAALADPLGPARAMRDPGRTRMADQAARLRELLEIAGVEAGSAPPDAASDGSNESVDPAAERAATRVHASGSGTGSFGRPAARTARVIAVSSGKGGVGKTTVAVNLAASLGERGVRTVLVDADLGTANADILCGVTPHARLDHVVTELPVHDGARRTLADIATPAPGGFRLIPGSAGIARLADLSDVHQRALLADLTELERDADAILIDTGAGVGRNVVRFVAASDVALIVLTPEPTSLTDAYSLIKCLHRDLSLRHGAWTGVEPCGPRISVVVNQASSMSEARQVFARLASVAERFLAVRVHFGGCVAQDLRVGESIRARRPVVLGSPSASASQDLRSLAAYLVRELGLQPGGGGSSSARSRSARPSLIRRWFGG